MKLTHTYLFFLAFIFSSIFSFAQYENTKWYFSNAALDFMTNPPTPLYNSAMSTLEGCSSIADATGNLLFYTSGTNVYNAAHSVMANGTGLNGNSSSAQSAIIVKQPSSATIYYIFTMGIINGTGLCYSIVDMSLAAGMGSVTVKNFSLNSGPSQEKLTATKHSNGMDYWIMTRQNNTADYKAYLLTSAGVNTVPVISTIGGTYGGAGIDGYMKFSGNGQKFADARMAGVMGMVVLYDFNRTTGVLSNSLALPVGSNRYGCDFSPDGTKLYSSNNGGQLIIQWDLSAGSNAAIVSSAYTVSAAGGSGGGIQVAPNGKVYIAANSSQSIHVINNPNVAGASCNFVAFGQLVGPGKTSGLGLPAMFVNPCFTFTAGVGNITGCFGSGAGSASVLAVVGNSGTPTYTWTNGTNTFNTQSINNVTAGTWTITIADSMCVTSEIVTITQPPAITISITPSSATACVKANVVLTATASGGAGSFGYLWQNFLNSNLYTASQNAQGTYIYTVTASDVNLCTATKTISIDFLDNPVLGLSPNQTLCTGQSATLTASGATTYTWFPNAVASNSLVVSPTLVGTDVYTVVGTNTNQCSASNTLAVSFYTNPILSVSPNQTICSNQSATLNVNGSTNYTWQPNNIVSNSIVVSPTLPITIYTVTATNNICGSSETVQVNFYANPTLIVTPTQSICPTFSTALNVSGANTYTWQPNNIVSNAITVSPLSTSIYTVTGIGIGNCESTETVQVFIYPLPTLSFNTHSINCANLGSATVTPIGGYGVYNYTWSSVPAQNNAVAINLNPNTYTVIVHDVNTNCVVDSTVAFISPIPLTGNLHNQTALLCNGVNTGTAYFSNLAGGSGNENYVWANGTITLTTNTVNTLSIGQWSVSVTDALTACQINSVFTITQPPALTLNVASSSQSICTGYNFTLTANASGGVGNFSYTWQTPTTTSSVFVTSPSVGTHIFTASATDNNNCVINNTIQVYVVPPPSLTVSLSSPSLCAQAFSGSANTITLTSSGANSYTLHTPNHISNTSPQNPSVQLNVLPPYQPTGLSTATVLGSNGVCTVSTTTNFSVIPNPIVSVNNSTPLICTGESYTYTSNGASSYTWSSLTPNSTLYTYGSIAITNSSINSVFSVVGESLGCFSPLVTTSITVNSIPEVKITPSNTYVCLGKAMQLTASGTNGNSYTWFPIQSLNQSTGNVVYASPTTEQTYTVVASLNNCTSSAVATLSVKPLPNPHIQFTKNGKCAGDSIILKGSGGMGYEWTFPNGQSLWGFPELRLKAENANFSGTYTLTVYDIYACSNSKTQSIKINPLPSGNITAQYFESCVPLCNDFSFKTSSQSSITVISWQMNNKNFSNEKVNYCFSTAGTYSIQASVRDENSCTNTFTTQVIVFPQPLADYTYTPTQPIESLDEVNFINTSKGAEKYTWEFSIVNFSSHEKDPNYIFENTGTYAVALIAQSDKQCLDTVVKSIYILPDFSIFVPNAFTPNGDNLNDVFIPVTRGATQFRLQIFNRWGANIFESTEQAKGWDGTFKDEACKAGVYVWKLIVSNNREEKELIGSVLLER